MDTRMVEHMTDSTDQLLGTRGQTHGDFTVHSEITQELKNVMTAQASYKQLSPVQKEALEMIQHKIGRILAGNPDYKDHWDDIAGYARLVGDRL
jgi:hypothetical protein